MNLLRRALLLAGIGVLATTAGYFAHRWRRAGAALPGVRGDILRGRYVDLDGSPRTLESLAGKILVINYWATWCEPCRKEIPVFVRLQQEYAVKNVQFVGIAIDQADKVREFAKEFGIAASGPAAALASTPEIHTVTLEESGRAFKVSRERIRQIEKKALKRLKHPTRKAALEDFLE